MLDSLPPDHWLFYVIDGILYLLILAILVPILHLCLRLFAKHQTDEGKGKALLAVLLILLGAAAVVAQPYAEQMGYFVLIPCLLVGAGVLRWICWVSIPRGFVIMVIFGAVVFGANTGIMALASRVLPDNRVTLLNVVRKSMGRLDEVSELAKKQAAEDAAKGTGKRLNTSNLLLRAKSGLLLDAESLSSAVSLLKDPKQLAALTSEHTEDLAALDLIAGGELLTPEDMAEMGIINAEAKKGMTVLQSVNATNEITEQDVEDVALFIRSVRKDGSAVSANDALVVIREARKRAAARTPFEELVQLTTQNTADLKGLGPILDGGKLAPEQLASLGIAGEGAKKGMSVLEGIRGTNNVGEQDVRSVMSLLKSMRKDGSQVSTNDALIVIREAMKRAGRSPTNAPWLALSTNSIVAKPLAVGSTSTVQKAAAKVVIQQRSRNIDPLLALGPLQRAAWNRSQTGLVVTAVMAFSAGNAMAIVNGEMVHTGDVLSVTSEGRSYKWRLATLNAHGVIWEPVVGAQSENKSSLVRWE